MAENGWRTPAKALHAYAYQYFYAPADLNANPDVDSTANFYPNQHEHTHVIFDANQHAFAKAVDHANCSKRNAYSSHTYTHHT